MKDKINQIFKSIGVKNPLKQKLVEPRATYFGGQPDRNFDRVDWDMVVDYFEYEAASYATNIPMGTGADQKLKRKRVKDLQDRAERKYGHIFFHYSVYADGRY